MKREQILNQAKDLITGSRAKDYGDAYDNHARIAEGWNIIMREALKSSGYLTPAHVALMMDWVKTCRLLNTIGHEDSWIDKAGYTALGAEFALRDERPINEIIKDARFGRTTDGDVRPKK